MSSRPFPLSRTRCVFCFATLLFGCAILGFVGCPSTPPGPNPNGQDITAPPTISGAISARNFSLPQGSTSTLTGDAEIVATGNVTIEGLLQADTSTGNGYNLTIRADGDVTISGTVQAGAPAKGLDAKQGPNTPGADGGSVRLVSGGNLTIHRTAYISGIDGTNGADGKDGGVGGKGGDVILMAGNSLRVRGTIVIGSGGYGGDAESMVNDATTLYFNGGGDSGYLYVSAKIVDWPGFDASRWAIDLDAYDAQSDTGLMFGGSGGGAGLVSLFSNPGDCATVVGPIAQPTAVRHIVAAPGGHGWLFGGFGGYISLSGGCTWNGLNGIDWEVVAGNGGDVTPPTGEGDLEGLAVAALRAVGGDGGWANVVGANGRLSGSTKLPGGNGAMVTARAGRGGDGATALSQLGGKGGDAQAQGGKGGDGWPLECEDPPGPGGDGGKGGWSIAYAGDGGNGATPGKGGMTTVLQIPPICYGGDGGRGTPGGVGGDGGVYRSKEGESGVSNYGDYPEIITPTVNGPAGMGQTGEAWNCNP